jgi:hypothetical protein
MREVKVAAIFVLVVLLLGVTLMCTASPAAPATPPAPEHIREVWRGDILREFVDEEHGVRCYFAREQWNSPSLALSCMREVQE